MRTTLRTTEMLVLAGLLFFLVLVTLFTLEPDPTGQATTRTTVNITDSTPANCSVIVGAGTNTVSWPCITTATSVTSIINDTSNVDSMYQYVPGSSDLWRVYTPNLPSWVVSDLQFLSRRAGYVLRMNATANFTFEGFIVTSTNIPIVTGWQLVGYPTDDIRNASDAFANINDSITEVRTYNNSLGIYESYLNPGGGTLNTTVPGEGYWINGTQADTWVVNG